MKRILAAAVWRVLPDPARTPPIRYVQCKECEDRSVVSPAQSVGDLWAMTHSGSTGHTRYREFAASDLVTERDRRKRP